MHRKRQVTTGTPHPRSAEAAESTADLILSDASSSDGYPRGPTASLRQSAMTFVDKRHKFSKTVAGFSANRSQSAVNLSPTAVPARGGMDQVELSLESNRCVNNNVRGRCLRIFCESVLAGSHFFTIFATDKMSIDDCLNELVSKHFTRIGQKGRFTLREVIGRQPDGEAFYPVHSRTISGPQPIIDLFTLLKPTSGLKRRLELHRLPSPPPAPPLSTDVRCPQLIDQRRSRSVVVPRNAPAGPHLLLIKGCAPRLDRLIHDLNCLFQTDSGDWLLSIGFSKNSKIPLLFPSETVAEANLAAGAQRAAAQLIGTTERVTSARNSHTKNIVWLEQLISHDEFRILVNKRPFAAQHTAQHNQCSLNAGDVIEFVLKGLRYIFLFKDSNQTHEDSLVLPVLDDARQASLPRPPAGPVVLERTIYAKGVQAKKRYLESSSQTDLAAKLAQPTARPNSPIEDNTWSAIPPFPPIASVKRLLSLLNPTRSAASLLEPTGAAALVAQLARAAAKASAVRLDSAGSFRGRSPGIDPDMNRSEMVDYCSKLLDILRENLKLMVSLDQSVSARRLR